MIIDKTIRECLGSFSFDTLRMMMQEKGIVRTEAYSKNDLCENLARHMLQPEIMEKYFTCLFDDEIERLENGIISDLERGMREGSDVIPELLCQSEYAFRMSDNPEDAELFWIPRDVAEAYLHMKSETFNEKRKDKNHFLSCLMAVGAFYGYVPLDVIAPVMKKQMDEVIDAVEALPKELQHYIVVGDALYHRDLYLEDLGLAIYQKDVPYYVPDEDELKELGRWGYLPSRPEMRALVGYLVTRGNMQAESAEYVAMWIQKMVAAGGYAHEIYEYLEDYGVFDVGEIPVDFEELMIDFRRNTRMLKNRGFTEVELSGTSPMDVFKYNQSIISMLTEDVLDQLPFK